MKNGGSFLLLLWIFPCWSSAFAPSSSVALLKSSHQPSKSWLADFLNGDSEVPVAEVSDEAQSLFPTAEFLELEITLHRPLGCTVEESLADHPVEHVVFVSKVVPGGFAETAGLQIGDVLVGVTGNFGKLESVTGVGVEKVKGLVGSVPDEDPLTMAVARGTPVMAQHEDALVELCASPGTSDKEVEECVVQYIAEGYNYQPDETDQDGDEMECDEDDDTECLLDGMHLMWADDLPPPSTAKTVESTDKEPATQEVKPWSSRSSGSGTYVRDPKTGEMRNIDLD